MSTDWAADVRKYAPNADDKAIAGIVRYCGIALQKRDSSLVSFGDKEEVARVRSNFLKKLGLTQPPPFIYDLRSTNDLGCRLNLTNRKHVSVTKSCASVHEALPRE